ncbi:unnamed protein product, partial [Didymodactylos carnosus]
TAGILAGVAVTLGLLRICLAFYKSKSWPSRFVNRRRPTSSQNTVGSSIAVIDVPALPKLDLPPKYEEAIALQNRKEWKLPSYEEFQKSSEEPTTLDTIGNNSTVTTLL